MATESEIKKYKNLISDSALLSLNNLRNTYVKQIGNVKSKLSNADFTDWEDPVSSKFQLHYESLENQYSIIESNVKDDSNLDILIKSIEGLKLKCDEYLNYLDEFNSISTKISFSSDKDEKEYRQYKNGKKSYTKLSQKVKDAISRSNANKYRKETLQGLMDSCSENIDTVLSNIKSIDFNKEGNSIDSYDMNFSEETTETTGHYSSEKVREQYEISKGKYDGLIERLSNIELGTAEGEDAITEMSEEALDILNEYTDAMFLMYLKGEISYEEFESATNPWGVNMMIKTSDGYDISVYDIFFGNMGQTCDINEWYDHNDEYRHFAERFNKDGCSSQEFLQSVPPLSYFYQNGYDIDYNNTEVASQYAAASLVELLENGYTGDVIQDLENEAMTQFNNKAGDRKFNNGYIDLAKGIINDNWYSYNSAGGAFNQPTENE